MRLKLFYGLVMVFLPFLVYSQGEKSFTDTTYFIPYDDDFNLIMAASKGHMMNVGSLLERGARVNAVTIDGISALMYAAENGDFEMVRFLLEKGADPNLKPWNGVTALISSVKLNNFNVAELLIANGAEINAKDDDGVTPLHYTVAYNYPEMTEMLLFFEADPGIKDDNGNIAIVTAAYNNSPDALRVLLEKGIDPDMADGEGNTALMMAVRKENKEIFEQLMKAGADVNKANKTEMTPLAFAIVKGNYEISSTLIEAGADVNQNTGSSRNLLELAMDQHQDEIAELLIAEGASSSWTPNFNKYSIGAGMLFSNTDFFTGLNFSLMDTKYNTGINTGFLFRPVAVRVQTYPENDTLYQYWERRYNFYLGLEKRINLTGNPNQQTGPFIGGRALYTFGGYRGTREKPGGSLVFAPLGGWYYMSNWLSLSIHYEYLNFDIPTLSKGYLNILFSINLGVARRGLTEKQIDWLLEE